MIIRFVRDLLAVFLMLVAAPSLAADRHIEVALSARSAEPRPGATTRLAITLTPQEGWHAYWRNPGDSGLAPEATWRLPEGVSIRPLEHPAPHVLELGGFTSYVHEGQVVLLADLVVNRSVRVGAALPLRGTLTWLACSDSLCVPERAELALDLRTGDGRADPGARTLFAAAEGALPGKTPLEVEMARSGANWEIRVPTAADFDVSRAKLFPDAPGWFEAGAAQRTQAFEGGLRVFVPATVGSLPAGRFSGVLSDERRSVVVRAGEGTLAMPRTAASASSSPAGPTAVSASQPRSLGTAEIGKATAAPSAVILGETPAVFTALIGALIGGFLLNLMPCVFPILSLKALSLARSGADRRAARIEGGAYAAGSILATSALGALLLVARAMGQDLGWSFQLQDPRAILLLMILTLAIAFNLAGLFELRGPSLPSGWLARRHWQGAFGTGALAAIVATPCSGPFMGVALGAALVLPPLAALAVFAGLGLGMALPFLLIAMIPALQRLLPRPGPWMATFRRLLAIPMVLTAIALAWVLGRQSGVDGMAIGLVAGAAMALGLWWVGLRQRVGRIAAAALVPIALSVTMVLLVELPASPTAVAPVRSAAVEPFSERRLAELRAQGTPVFVDMTADWCLICQVNQRVAVDRPATREAFARTGVVTLVGDWTRGDPAITQFLKTRGRNSIPYYLFSDASGREVELPQVLTSDLLVTHARRGET